MATEHLDVTIIDVGWGDSILVESYIEDNGQRTNRRFGLIDSNDEPGSRISHDFITRYFQTSGVDLKAPGNLFDFVILTHWHSDHGSGLEYTIRKYGTQWFWYPKGNDDDIAKLGSLYSYSRNAVTKIVESHAIDNDPNNTHSLNNTEIRFLWPPVQDAGPFLRENHASIVMELKLGNVCFLLTGDCEAENWPNFIDDLPTKGKIKVFKVPHHGSQNGVFDNHGGTPWLDYLAKYTKIAMSSHISPHKHPHPDVVNKFNAENIKPFRTDLNYHLTFKTDGAGVQKKWSRF